MQLITIDRPTSCRGRLISQFKKGMKLTAILLLAACLQVSARSEGQTLTLKVKNMALKNVFKEIQRQTGLDIFLDEVMLEKKNKVTLDVTNMPVSEVLAICFRNDPFTFSIIDKRIVVKQKTEVVQSLKNSLSEPPPTIELTGQVVNETNEPLQGVTVLLKNSKNAVNTDGKGYFKMNVPDNSGVLVFSSVGYKTQQISIGGKKIINVTMIQEFSDLENVVVTALGIRRQKKSLTYSVQTVDNAALNDVKDANLVNNLTGRVAGVTISRSSSGIGGSVRVVIRGNKSTRDNQPLYVIDGVPMSNSNPGQPGSIWGYGVVGSAGMDGGDGISNLNPEDIQDMTVLKGASAAALYGSQASNGVIIINTKKGKAGATRVNVSSDLTIDKPIFIQPLQFKYGQTVKPSAGNPGSQDSWGEVVNASDHVTPFFQTGITSFNTVSLTGGTEKSQSYFSYSYTDNKGIIPTASLNKHNITFHQTTDFFNGRLKADVNVMYMHENSHNRPVSGLYNNALSGLYEFPRGLNFDKFKNGYKVYSSVRNIDVQNWWNANYDSSVVYPGSFSGGGQGSQQNPYWLLKRNSSNNILDRIYSNFSLNFKINDWLNLQTRGNIDKSINDINYSSFATTSVTITGKNGSYDFLRTINTQFYGDFILNADRKLSNDLTLQATIGASIKDGQGLYNQFGTLYGGDGLRFANVFNLVNILPSSLSVSEGRGHDQTQAVFGTVQFNLRDYLFLDLTGRNDWSSSLAYTPVEKKGYFYYSAGITGMLSDIFKMPEAITYSKVRVSYAKVGNDVPSYATNPVAYYIDNQQGSRANTKGPKPGTFLKPEDNRSFEVGTEWNFVNNRFGFDFTYYINNNFRQYMEIPVSAGSTGNLSTWYLNSGDIKNNGVELSVFATPIKTQTFSWDIDYQLRIQ